MSMNDWASLNTRAHRDADERIRAALTQRSSGARQGVVGAQRGELGDDVLDGEWLWWRWRFRWFAQLIG